MRKIADLSLTEALRGVNVPDAVHARIGAPEFVSLLASERSLRADLATVATDGDRVRYHAVVDAHRAVKARLLAYRQLTAAHLADRAVREAPLLPVPETMRTVGHAEAGSAEWLRMRQPTLGGSDIGPICKVGQYGALAHKQNRASHVDPEPADQDHEGASLIGDQWEPVLMEIVGNIFVGTVFADPDTHSDGERHVNVDGFMLDHNGALALIVEGKTASNPAVWDGQQPGGYVLQTQHYMHMLNAPAGALIVNVNDDRIMVFLINPEDTVPAGPESPQKLGAEFSYTQVREYAVGMIQRWNTDRANGPTERARCRVAVDDALRDTWAAALTRGMVFVGLETTHFTPNTGYIIEFGGVREDGTTFQRLYGVPADHLEWNGTGVVSVHNITAAMIANHDVLRDTPSALNELREFIGDRVLVAHHASFEEQWLTEAGVTVTTADTVSAFSALVDDLAAQGNSMADFTAWAGVEYVDAHRALTDATMLAEAFTSLRPLIEQMVATRPKDNAR